VSHGLDQRKWKFCGEESLIQNKGNGGAKTMIVLERGPMASWAWRSDPGAERTRPRRPRDRGDVVDGVDCDRILRGANLVDLPMQVSGYVAHRCG
jgi:hypothetical protein